MAHSNLETALHAIHHGHKLVHTQAGQAVATAAVTGAAVAGHAAVGAAVLAAPVVLPVAAVAAVTYGLYRLFGGK